MSGVPQPPLDKTDAHPHKGQTTAAMVIRAAGLLLGAGATALLARLLQPEGFGAYSFVVAVVTILGVPVVTGLRQTLVRELSYAEGREEPSRGAEVWGWVLRRAIWATLILAMLLALWVFRADQSPDLRWHLMLGLVIFALQPVPQLLGGVLHGLGRVVQSQLPEFLLRPVLMIALLGAVWLMLPKGALTVGGALGLLVVTLVADAALCLVLLRRGAGFALFPNRPHLPPDQSRALTTTSLAFGAIASVHLVNSNLDIVMLGLLTSDAQVGIYKAATVLSLLAAFGLGVVNSVIMPRIARLHASGNRAALQAVLTRATRVIAVFGLAGAVILCVFGTLLLRYVFDAGYTGGYTALVILTVGQFANACFGPVALVLNMTGHQKVTLIGVSASVVLNAALNLMLVPRFGIEGAAVATSASLILWNALLVWALRQRTGYVSTIWR